MKVEKFEDASVYHAPNQEIRRARLFDVPTDEVQIGESIYGPGMEAPYHAHDGWELMIVLHGTGEFGTENESVTVGPGTLLYFPPGEEHYLKQKGCETLEFIFIYTTPEDAEPLVEKWYALEE